jgi:hypothetical protein
MGCLLVRYLSDVNLRAVLAVLVSRAGGTVEIANAELYDAMLPDQGRTERFLVEETSAGVRVSLMPQGEGDTRP